MCHVFFPKDRGFMCFASLFDPKFWHILDTKTTCSYGGFLPSHSGDPKNHQRYAKTSVKRPLVAASCFSRPSRAIDLAETQQLCELFHPTDS